MRGSCGATRHRSRGSSDGARPCIGTGPGAEVAIKGEAFTSISFAGCICIQWSGPGDKSHAE